VREPGGRGEAPLLGTLKDLYRKGQETGVFLHRGSVGDPLEGTVLCRGIGLILNI
jgi:hypothetical protein